MQARPFFKLLIKIILKSSQLPSQIGVLPQGQLFIVEFQGPEDAVEADQLLEIAGQMRECRRMDLTDDKTTLDSVFSAIVGFCLTFIDK